MTDEQCEKIRLSKLGKSRSKNKSVGVFNNQSRWTSRIGFRGEDIYLGMFDNKCDAEMVYKLALERVKNNQRPDMSVSLELRRSKCKAVIQSGGDVTIEHESARAASRTGFNLACILRCCHNKQKKHKKYTWSFA